MGRRLSHFLPTFPRLYKKIDINKFFSLLVDLLPKGNKEEQRDYVFYLSVANYRLKVSSLVGGFALSG